MGKYLLIFVSDTIAWSDSIAFQTDSIAQSDAIGKAFRKKNVQVLILSIDKKAVSKNFFDHIFGSLWCRKKLLED